MALKSNCFLPCMGKAHVQFNDLTETKYQMVRYEWCQEGAKTKDVQEESQHRAISRADGRLNNFQTQRTGWAATSIVVRIRYQTTYKEQEDIFSLGTESAEKTPMWELIMQMEDQQLPW